MAADSSSGGFGAKLRDARERRGVSLRQIANATKISIAALEALERNDVSRLPGGIFSRAFVRSYAIEVGLDPDTTIQEFISQFPNDSVTAGHPTSEPAEDHVSVDNDRRMASTFLWLIGISLPIAGAMLYFAATGRGIAHEEPAPPAPLTPPVESRPAVDPAPAALSPGAALPGAPSTPSTGATSPAGATSVPPAAAPTDRLAVALSVRRPCWVSATVDGVKTIERLLQPGDQTTIDVRRELVLTAGDASAITLTLNGAGAKPLGKTGEVVTVRINPTNFSEFVQTR